MSGGTAGSPGPSTCTRRRRSISPTSGSRPGFPGDELPPGWTLEATLGRLDRTFRARVEGIDRTTLRGWTLEDQRLMFSHAAGLLSAMDEPLWEAVHRKMAPPLDGLVTWHVDQPGIARWSAEQPNH